MKLQLLLMSLLIIYPFTVSAHEGHDDAPGEEHTTSEGPVEISVEAKKNLGLEVFEVKPGVIKENVSVVGQIEPIPSLSSVVTSRISGKVFKLFALEGQQIKKGEPLIQIESRLLGDPPPRVIYSSPLDGIVLERRVNSGESVEPDKNLLKIADIREVYAVGKIYEGQIHRVAVGQTVGVQVEALGSEPISGRVEHLGGSLDPVSRTLNVWVRISNSELKLRPNMRALLSISTSNNSSSIIIPRAAVLGEMGNYFVFVQDKTHDLEFEKRFVVVGTRDDQNIEIIRGVRPLDKVVTVGNYQLQYLSPKKK